MKFSSHRPEGESDARWTVELSKNELFSLAGMIMTGVKYRESGQTTEDICAAIKFGNLTALCEKHGWPWNNDSRSRYYGKRIGDIVKRSGKDHTYLNEGEVVGFGFMDNNRLYIVWNGTKEPVPEVAESMDIITKTEDRK